MLASKILQFPLRSGVDEGIDPKTAPPGTLLRAKNAYWKKSNLLEKRFGTDPLTTPDFSNGGSRLFTRGDELSVIGDDIVKTYSSQGTWKTGLNSGRISDVGLKWATSLDLTSGVKVSDIGITSDGKITQAWITGDPFATATRGDLYYQVINEADGAILVAPTLLRAQVDFVRVLARGTLALIIVSDGADIVAYESGSGTPTTLRADAAGNSAFDACLVSDSAFVLAYVKATGITLYRFTFVAAPVSGATDVVTGEAGAVVAVSIDGDDSDTLYIGYYLNTPLFRFATANPVTLAQVVVPTTIDATGTFGTVAVMRYDATSCVYAYTANGTNATTGAYRDGVLRSCKISNAGVTDFLLATYYMRLLSRPFMIGTKVYVYGGNPVDATGVNALTYASDSYLLGIDFDANSTAPVNAPPHRYVGHIDLLIGGGWYVGSVPNVPKYNGVAYAPLPFQSTPASERGAGIRQGLRLVRATAGSDVPDMWRPMNVGQETYLSASVLTAWDGRLAFDYGMAGSPLFDGATVTSNGAGVLVAGTYLYSSVAEYRSMGAVLHRGPPTVTLSVAVVAPNDTVTLQVIPVHLSQKSTTEATATTTEALRVVLALYRTVVGGSVLQRLTAEPVVNTLFQTYGSPLPLVDLRADANMGLAIPLSVRPVIYTASVLPDYQPPANTTLFYHVDRLWVLAGDERTWWYSKTFQDDLGVAPGFHPNFRIIFPERMVAGASMDEKGVFFSETSIWYLLGSGPAPNGTNSDFSVPQQIQTDAGCTNPRSVISMPEGIMFEGAGDIFLLTRGLEVQWIGKPVLEQLRAYPTITSAVLLSKRNEVRFSCNDVTGELGIVLVYNYVEKQWTTFEYTSNDVLGLAISDAVLWQNLYTYLTVTGRVYQEDESTHLDEGDTWVEMDVETAENFAEGPLSYQRVRRAYLKGELGSQCDVRLRIAVNGRDAYDQDRTFASETMIALGTAKVGLHVKTQKSDSIRLRVTDAPPSSLGLDVGIGKGIDLSAIGFEVAPKVGMDKRAPEAKK